jgi:hypothetical protein
MTLINRLQRIGGVMFDEITTKSIPMEGAANYWDPHVREAIDGIRLLSSQIRDEMPKRQGQLQFAPENSRSPTTLGSRSCAADSNT